MNVPLNDGELRAVLTRAAEIQHASRGGPNDVELERLIGAAEAAGYSRVAVERALRERFGSVARPQVGELAFARAANGKYHVARIVSDAPAGTRVKFVLGTESEVAPDHVRPFSLAPGDRVWVDWPMWGAWLCEVLSYDEERSIVKLSDRWGSQHTCAVSEIWVQPPSERVESSLGSFARHLASIGGFMAAGALIGSLVTAYFLR
jgi:hypothetical protein